MNAAGPTVILWVAFAALALWVAWWVRREVRAAKTAHRDEADRPKDRSLINALEHIRMAATIHYMGGAFDPEHMRSIANIATSALNGDEVARPPQCLHLQRRVTHSDTGSVTWVCDMCGTQVTDPKETTEMTLLILAATPNFVVFQTGSPETWTATVADLDRARLRIARYGNARIGPHSVDESDIVALHNAIRAAPERSTP